MFLTSTHNGLRQRFVPIGERVRIYVCGVTPYDTTHVGHLFTFAAFDVLARYLRSQGLHVTYVQNVTDVDDDMMRKARELGTTWDALAADQVGQLLRDFDALNIARPDHFPKASDQIEMILTMVSSLVEQGRAYASGGNVYFDSRADPRFGPPSSLTSYADMLAIANERGNTPGDPLKRDPLDFVLWQASAPEEPSWPSPWGPGRPGWHIECSAMCYRYLGSQVDIHGGGSDLIFPHHACERLQSEHFTGVEPFVRFWLHVGMVRLGGEKMSKSLGNLVLARQLTERWSPNAIRLALANHHYREEWDWEDADLAAMTTIAEDIDAALGSSPIAVPTGSSSVYRQRLQQAMDDDLDTPEVVRTLAELARVVRAGSLGAESADAGSALRDYASILGLRVADR